MSRLRAISVSAIPTVLGLVSAALGVWTMISVELLLTKLVWPVLIPVDPLHVTQTGGLRITVRLASILVLSIAWLIAIIPLFPHYSRGAARKDLSRRFLVVTAIEVAPIVLFYALLGLRVIS
jgi:hypothetical protein